MKVRAAVHLLLLPVGKVLGVEGSQAVQHTPVLL